MEEAPIKRYFIEQEYLMIDRLAERRSEFYDGEIYAMAGVGGSHNTINYNLAGLFYPITKKRGCQGYTQDMRVKISEKSAYTFPDFIVACNKTSFLIQLDILTNPLIIIEILSANTMTYDRGKKFDLYKSIASLKQYVLIDSTRQYSVQSFNKTGEGIWEQAVYTEPSDEVRFDALDCQFSLADFYDNAF